MHGMHSRSQLHILGINFQRVNMSTLTSRINFEGVSVTFVGRFNFDAELGSKGNV